MAGNESFRAAKVAKEDEFYTQRGDIENELSHYAEQFRGKVVYCNCDDPVSSEFWQFFVRVFQAWGLKKLIATHYEPDAQNYSYKLEMEPDENGQFNMFAEPVKTPLPCNGDFRSAACIELLKEADIVVTNPPFSLFREYVAQLMEYGKKFLIIGNQNAITYKEIFPLIKDNAIWLGYGFQGGNAYFAIPPGTESRFAKGVYNPETGLVKFRNCCWFTNLDHAKRHTPLDLRGNYYRGSEAAYPRYDNYDAIEVSKVADIPSDYDNVMGVPITFLDKHCPEQFEIVGITRAWLDSRSKVYPKQIQHNVDGSTQIVGKLNDSIAFEVDTPPVGRVYYEVDGKYYIKGYSRILIRRKKDA